MPSACETDITGAIGMYAMTLASGVPSALVDCNNNCRTHSKFPRIAEAHLRKRL